MIAFIVFLHKDIVFYWDLFTISRALKVYFEQNNSYPRHLDVLVGHSLVRKDVSKHAGYSVADHGGSFTLAYKTPQGNIVHSGPPFSHITREAKIDLLKNALFFYYGLNKSYPRKLEGAFLEAISPELAEEISKGLYSYSVSEDLQHYTLDGNIVGPPGKT
jgi:hypothetical protein